MSLWACYGFKKLSNSFEKKLVVIANNICKKTLLLCIPGCLYLLIFQDFLHKSAFIQSNAFCIEISKN